MTELQKFKSRICPDANSGCWTWIGSTNGWGYGKTWLGEPAHRAAFKLFKGVIPAGLWVLHTCDNKLCVNPDHLYAGTREDNVRDLWDRHPEAIGGRANSIECHLGHKLSGDNLYISPKGKRGCRACRKMATDRQQEKR